MAYGEHTGYMKETFECFNFAFFGIWQFGVWGDFGLVWNGLLLGRAGLEDGRKRLAVFIHRTSICLKRIELINKAAAMELTQRSKHGGHM